MVLEFIFVVCSVTPLNPWIGDKDTGPTCAKIESVPLSTLAQCKSKQEDTLKYMSTEKQQFILETGMLLSGPYTYFSECRAKLGVGPLPCNDCEEEG